MEDIKCCSRNMKKYTHRAQEEKKYLARRLNIIEGQIRGVRQMIDDDRYCDDVLTQLMAVNKSIESLENTILENHMKNCMNRELKAGNDQIINEVMELFKRLR